MGARLPKPVGKTSSKRTAQKSAVQKEKAVPAQSAQDRFLGQMIDEHRRVAVFLSSGIKLEGEILCYDQYVILMKGTMTDKVYKHAISTIQPLEEERSKAPVKARAGTAGAPTIIRRAKPRLIKNSG